MPEFITKEKVKEIMANAPNGQGKETVQRLIDKGYEIEGYNAEFSPFETVKNIGPSALEFGKAIWSTVSNPVQTAKAIGSLGLGVLRNGFQTITGNQLPVGGESNDKALEGMAEFFINRYGSKDKLLNTIEKDPVGFLSDAASVMGGAGVAIKGLGAVSKVGKIVKAGDVIAKYSRLLEPTTAATKLARGFNELSGMNNFLRRASDRFMSKATTITKSNISNTVKIPERSIKVVGRELFDWKKPETWLAEHGISGGLEDIHKQVATIQYKTQDIVDNLLASAPDAYKTDSATKFLTELRNAYGRVVDDIVEGVDLKKSIAVDKAGNPIKVVEEIPYKQREPVFVPMENMSEGFKQNLSEIQDLLQKNKTEGLTLTELNRVKRIGDEILNIYDKSGEVKAARTARNLAGLRSEIRKFIEDKATEKGIPDIQALNKQTQMSLLIKEHVADLLNKTEVRSALGDQLIFLMGLTGTVASGGTAPLLGAAAVVGGREIARLPRVRSFMATRLRLLTDSDYKELLRAVDNGKVGKKARDIIRRERKLVQKAFPELRLAGIAEQQIPVKEEQ